MFVMATASPYRVNWKATRNDLLVVSVGTGLTTETNPEATAFGLNILELATTLPGVLIGGSQVQQDLLCRVFGECRFGLPIDREVGDLRRSRGPGRKLFSYVRYNAELDDATLGGLGLGHLRAGSIRRMDAVKHIGALAEVGRAVAEAQVRGEHLAGF
jgi:hypothetical protein